MKYKLFLSIIFVSTTYTHSSDLPSTIHWLNNGLVSLEPTNVSNYREIQDPQIFLSEETSDYIPTTSKADLFRTHTADREGSQTTTRDTRNNSTASGIDLFQTYVADRRENETPVEDDQYKFYRHDPLASSRYDPLVSSRSDLMDVISQMDENATPTNASVLCEKLSCMRRPAAPQLKSPKQNILGPTTDRMFSREINKAQIKLVLARDESQTTLEENATPTNPQARYLGVKNGHGVPQSPKFSQISSDFYVQQPKSYTNKQPLKQQANLKKYSSFRCDSNRSSVDNNYDVMEAFIDEQIPKLRNVDLNTIENEDIFFVLQEYLTNDIFVQLANIASKVTKEVQGRFFETGTIHIARSQYKKEIDDKTLQAQIKYLNKIFRQGKYAEIADAEYLQILINSNNCFIKNKALREVLLGNLELFKIITNTDMLNDIIRERNISRQQLEKPNKSSEVFVLPTLLSTHLDEINWEWSAKCPMPYPWAQKFFHIKTGALISFSGNALASKIIAGAADKINGDTLHLSHVGVLVVAYPTEIIQIIEYSAKHGGLFRNKEDERTAKIMGMNGELQNYLEVEEGIINELAVFCFQSTGSHGVRIVPLEYVLMKNERSSIYIRNPIGEDITLSLMMHSLADYMGASYNMDLLTMARAINANNSTTKDNKHSYFCSQLVCKIYKDCGLLAPVIKPENCVPSHFGSTCTTDLLHGSFGPEILIKQPVYRPNACGGLGCFFGTCCKASVGEDE